MFPAVDRTFVSGLRGALSDAGVDHQLLLEPVGVCAVKDQVVERVQRVLLQEPDVVTGIMGAGLSRHVHEIFSGARVPFILNDMGADPVMTGAARNPFVIGNTLNLWQSMYALGAWAARNLGTKAAVAAALHDAGYGMVQAFWLGFSNAGGAVLGTEVTHRASADQDPSESLGRIAALEADFVMAFYAGREGASFVRAWNALGRGTRLPLIATPLMTHDHWLPGMDGATAGVRTAFSWDMSSLPGEHERFRRVAGIGDGMSPAVFALLGYETGRMLAAARERKSAQGSWRDALAGAAFSSPRGDLVVDPVTGEVATEDFLIEMRPGDDGTLDRATVSRLELPASYASDYETVRQSDARSGWLNPYLVT